MAKYIDKSAVVAEIERLRKSNKPKEDKDYAQFELDVSCGYNMALDDIKTFIDSLQEEPVSEDLEDFALQYAGHHAPYDDCMQEVEDAVKAGAKWQKEHGGFAR